MAFQSGIDKPGGNKERLRPLSEQGRMKVSASKASSPSERLEQGRKILFLVAKRLKTLGQKGLV